MEIKEKGYYTLKWGENEKTMHFSRLFLGELQRTTGKDITAFGQSMQEEEGELEQFDLVAELVNAAFLAYDKAEGNSTDDYNVHKVGNWLWDAFQESDTIVTEIINVMQDSLSGGKKKGAKAKK